MGATSYAIVNKLVQEGFTVTNRRNRRVASIPPNQFTYDLYDPTDNSSTISFSITELGNGHYRAEFTPDIIGTWYVVVYHPVYFPWGKRNDVVVQPNDIEIIRKQQTNKQVLTKIDDANFVQTIYDDDGTTIIKEFDLTCDDPNTETREPR